MYKCHEKCIGSRLYWEIPATKVENKKLIVKLVPLGNVLKYLDDLTASKLLYDQPFIFK